MGEKNFVKVTDFDKIILCVDDGILNFLKFIL